MAGRAGTGVYHFSCAGSDGCTGLRRQQGNQTVPELEKFGLIESKRRGLGKPNLIYVKNFADPRFRNREKNGSGAADSAQQETAKSRGNKTEWNKTEGSEPDPFSSDAESEPDERTRLEAYFMQSLEVDLLLRLCPDEEDTIDQIVNLLVDFCRLRAAYIRAFASCKGVLY